MRIRDLYARDIPRLRELHKEQGYDYEFPDLGRPDFRLKCVLVDEKDQVVQAVIARETVELYFIGDRHYATPRWRWEWFRTLHEHVRECVEKIGIHDAHLWIPPELEKSLGRRLTQGFGWRFCSWRCLWRTTERKG